MKTTMMILAAAAAVLAGCQKSAEGVGSGGLSRGRYLGVGHYAPGPLWPQLAAGAPKSPAAARLADDEQVVIVVDSTTGEIRQCGNLSGFCIGMNPWGAPLAPTQTTPVQLAKHASELNAAAETPPAKGAPTR